MTGELERFDSPGMQNDHSGPEALRHVDRLQGQADGALSIRDAV